MTKEELLELDPPEIAAKLNEVAANGGKDAALAEFGITQADLTAQQIFWVKDAFTARAWAGYTTTKRTGNELGDDEKGVGGSDPSAGYKGV